MSVIPEQTIGWRDLLELFSPIGQKKITSLIDQAKRDRGTDWLEALRTEKPRFYWICETVLANDAETAYEIIAAEFQTLPLSLVKPQMLAMHEWLRLEIEKPRFEG